MRSSTAAQRSLRSLSISRNGLKSSTASSSSSILASSSSSTSSPLLPPNSRSLFGFSFGKSAQKSKQKEASPFNNPSSSFRNKPLISQDDLFHPLSQSPIPAMRARGERVRRLAPCPVSMARDGIRRNVEFECPHSGWPTHHSEKEWREDTEHPKYIARLREANEDEHDLRSGREMVEFKLPGPQGFEETINMSNWDVFFYTRNHDSIETERSRRHVSKLLTFPSTVAGVLHENSPYTKRNQRLTHEGLRSMIALRQTLHPRIGDKPSLDVVRIFVVGARAEATLPPAVWDQLSYIFPGAPLHIFLIGPEAAIPADPQHPSGPTVAEETESGKTSSQPKSSGGASIHRHRSRKSNYGVPSRTITVSEGLTLTTIQSNYEDVHAQFEPFDPYTDAFFAFSPGFGFPSQVAAQEMERARAEDREDEKRMKAARETYNAGPIIQEQPETTSSTSNSRGFSPADISKIPDGGDIPSEEPAPAMPSLPGSSSSAFTSLTAAPVVQAQREWARAIGQILSTKCPLISTGFSPADVERDVLAFESVEGVRGEFEWLLTPGENVFASQQWAVADFDPRVAVKANWGLWAVRGKRYDIEGPRLETAWAGGFRGREEEE